MALLLQMPGDGDRAGVQAVLGQLQPQLDDPVTDGAGRRGRVRRGPARSRIDSFEAALGVAGQQPMQVLAGGSSRTRPRRR